MSDRVWGRRTGIAFGIGAAAAVLGVSAAVAMGVALARLAVTPSRRPETPIEVVSLDRSESGVVVWIRGSDADQPGRYSFVFDQRSHEDFGHAKLGPVFARRGESVAREVVSVEQGDLAVGARGRLTGWWFLDPDELGFRTERVEYQTELGPARAWIVHPRRARAGRWAVHVHGRGAPPAETLRGVAPLARVGITSLIITYRNDAGAPVGEHGRYANGIAESRDVDSAIAEALKRGAARVTLFGWSMGGTASLLAATRGAHRGVIDGLILDSPAVDWSDVLRHLARGYAAPRPVADVGIRMLDRGVVRAGEPGGIDFASLTAAAFGGRITVPTLIHASRQDHFVPSRGAEELAAARPDLVRLRLQRQGGHVRLWNVDPESWENATEQFADSLPEPSALG